MSVRIIIIALCAVVFVATVIRLAPAPLAGNLAQKNINGFSYSQAVGSLWQGTFEDAVLNGINLGTLDYKANAMSLLVGRIDLGVNLHGGAIVGHGKISARHHRVTIEDASFRVVLNGVTRNKIFDLPVTGLAEAQITKLDISKRGCLYAEGSITTDFLRAPARELGAEGFVMNGPASCEEKDLRLNLSGESSEGTADLTLLVHPDLSYDMIANAVPIRSEVADVLGLLGFEEGATGLNYAVRGTL